MMMDSSTQQLNHHQEIGMGSQTLESMLGCGPKSGQEKKARPADMQAQKCPRCDSSNTKFCYYNNYSLSQPRYFCKACRRYWTKGGTLRNVPVGGGCRRNKRSSSSSSSSTSSSRRSHDHHPILPGPALPSSYDDLGLAIARLQKPGGDGAGSGRLFGSEIDDNENFSIWGNFNGNYNYASAAPHHQHQNHGGGDQRYLGLGAFLESSIPPMSGGVQSSYYGNQSEIGSGAQGTTMSPFEEFGVKQEGSRVLWGFPWQSITGGGGDGNAADSWNGIGSNWHGLLNSPLV